MRGSDASSSSPLYGIFLQDSQRERAARVWEMQKSSRLNSEFDDMSSKICDNTSSWTCNDTSSHPLSSSLILSQLSL
ncbi:unnamed protein product [Prunus armeniaca]|uniref:Uncharacterized protein n=1 Tax=Prunus armeniaca TaxID=36596 RepID=A0A6J5WVD9_PRUAR|nr:unnamed protein product [Prunus armeniaca]